MRTSPDPVVAGRIRRHDRLVGELYAEVPDKRKVKRCLRINELLPMEHYSSETLNRGFIRLVERQR